MPPDPPDPSVRFVAISLTKNSSRAREAQILQQLYQAMPKRNFSMDFLEHVFNKVSVLDVKDVLWCDWGRPKRIAQGLRKIGKVPAFPTELVGVA